MNEKETPCLPPIEGECNFSFFSVDTKELRSILY